MPSNRPNILWYCTDQQRFDTIGALGNPHVHTPNLDSLVTTGAALTHAYCQNPICAPSRASFMTGRYPSAVGVNANGNAYFPPDAESTLISRLLREAGYDTGLVGKLHLAASSGQREPRADDGFRFFEWSHSSRDLWVPGDHDYADWLRASGHNPSQVLALRHQHKDRVLKPTETQDNVPPELHQTTWCSDQAIRFLDSAREPWLLCVNPFDPHPPFNPPWEYWRRFDSSEMPRAHFQPEDLFTQRRLENLGIGFPGKAVHSDALDDQALIRAYYAMIELVDEQVGRLLKWLDVTGQRERTVIVFMSDHGEMLGDHGLVQKGCRFYEGAVRVPLLVSWPNEIAATMQIQGLVELTDIAPTLLDLAGYPTPDAMQGHSFAPILRGNEPGGRHRDSVRSEYLAASKASHPTHATMFRDERWKVIVYHSHATGELYDLQADPWEHHDIWNDPGHAAIRADLVRRSFDATIEAIDPGPPRTHPY